MRSKILNTLRATLTPAEYIRTLAVKDTALALSENTHNPAVVELSSLYHTSLDRVDVKGELCRLGYHSSEGEHIQELIKRIPIEYDRRNPQDSRDFKNKFPELCVVQDSVRLHTLSPLGLIDLIRSDELFDARPYLSVKRYNAINRCFRESLNSIQARRLALQFHTSSSSFLKSLEEYLKHEQ